MARPMVHPRITRRRPVYSKSKNTSKHKKKGLHFGFSLGKKHKKQNLEAMNTAFENDSIVSNSKSKHKRRGLFGKKKHKNADDNMLIKTRLTIAREELRGPARLVGDRELQLMIDMDMSIDEISKIIKNRLIRSIIIIIVGFILGFVSPNDRVMFIAAFIVVAGLMWYIGMRSTSMKYRQFKLQRQIAFAQFTRLAAAYLPELKQGINMYSIFAKILSRMGNNHDRAALQKLMTDMSADPENAKPFLEFAHAFSTSTTAELIMTTIQQMYLGAVRDTSIRELAKQANNDMLRQCNTVIAYKLHKFNSLVTRVGVSAMIPIMAYFGLLVTNTIGKALNILH